MHKWTREETIIAFNVYCKLPFQNCSKTNPTIIKYAHILGRSPSALNMKIGNIGRLDPDLKKQGIKGLVHGAKMEEEVWNEFYKNPELLAYESEKIIAKVSHQTIEQSTSIETKDIPQGKERSILIKQRINQSFFRSAVLSSYNFHCCISGITIIELLEACHIVDWATDTKNRTNPKNGLCMNPFFHKAYDKHLLGITPDLKIVISDKLFKGITDDSYYQYLNSLNGREILLPNKFLPQRELLEIHYNEFIKRC